VCVEQKGGGGGRGGGGGLGGLGTRVNTALHHRMTPGLLEHHRGGFILLKLPLLSLRGRCWSRMCRCSSVITVVGGGDLITSWLFTGYLDTAADFKDLEVRSLHKVLRF